VLLPKGTWYDFATGEAFDGDAAVTRDVPLTEVAIFARAGAIVPMLPAGVESLVKTDQVQSLDDVRFEREVRVWLGAAGSEVDGEGGTYSLASSTRPMGQASGVEGALMTRTSSVGRVVFDAAPNTTASIVDAAGARHAISTASMDPKMKLRFDVRW
jgi:alpha-glucosidase (family GH31 glycosyl hydrolase)